MNDAAFSLELTELSDEGIKASLRAKACVMVHPSVTNRYKAASGRMIGLL